MVSSAVISFVVEAIARRSVASRWKSTSPVEASMRMADGALTWGGASCWARAGPATSSTASSAATSARVMG
jgi:hypothetical protein